MSIYTYEVDHGDESPVIEAGMQINGGKLTAVQFDAALARLEKLENSQLPIRKGVIVIQAFYLNGDSPFINGVYGLLTADNIRDIEDELVANTKLYFDLDGDYIFTATHYSGDSYTGEGAHFELTKVGFQDIPDITQDET